MVTVNVSHRVNAPVDRVFAVASDIPNAARFIEGITKVEMLTPGPVGVGTRFKETRVMFGKEATETMEVTAFDPPVGYTLTANSCGCLYGCSLHLEPDGAGTQVTMTFNSTPQTLMAKLFAPLGWLMSGMMKKHLLKDLADIQKAAEGAPSGVA